MANETINTKYIDEVIEITGPEPLIAALKLFHSQVVEYVTNCRQYFSNHAYEEAGKELHKIKGAASSVGLSSVADEAKKTELALLEQRENFGFDAAIEVLKDKIQVGEKTLGDYLKQKSN